MAGALPPPFLDPLFSISLMEDGELRQMVLEILHNIIDRHDNRAKLRGIRYKVHSRLYTHVSVVLHPVGFLHYLCVFSRRIIPNVAALKIKREKISKQDVAFMKKVENQSHCDAALSCRGRCSYCMWPSVRLFTILTVSSARVDRSFSSPQPYVTDANVPARKH